MQHLPEEYRKQIMVSAIVTIVVVGALAASAIYLLTAPNAPRASVLNAAGPQSHLIVQLTDPPIVPKGTTSLLLTYSEIDLLVSSSGTTQNNITIVPSSGTATVDLLALQNVSRTLESANVPTGAQVVSAAFHVSKIMIAINGSSYPVTIATGNSLIVSLPNLKVANGTNELLLELNPTILNSSTGYQLIPSSMGVLKPQTEISSAEGNVGYVQPLSDADQNELHHEKGSISANLLGFSVSDTTTSLGLQVTDSGQVPEHLVMIAIHGEFTPVCSSTTTTTTTSTTGSEDSSSAAEQDKDCSHGTREILFIPGAPQTVSVSTTYSGCAPRHMTLSNDWDARSNDQILPIVMNPAQCLNFGYTGILSFHEDSGNHVVIPSMEPGEKYIVHIIASSGAQVKLACTLHANSAPSCIVDHDDNDESD